MHCWKQNGSADAGPRFFRSWLIHRGFSRSLINEWAPWQCKRFRSKLFLLPLRAFPKIFPSLSNLQKCSIRRWFLSHIRNRWRTLSLSLHFRLENSYIHLYSHSEAGGWRKWNIDSGEKGIEERNSIPVIDSLQRKEKFDPRSLFFLPRARPWE